MTYIGKVYVFGADCFANSTTGTKDFAFQICKGDTFTVKRKPKENELYTAVYHGPGNRHRVGAEFGVASKFIDEFCTKANQKPEAPPCHCKSIDIASIGHLPTCEFKLAGGCGGNKIFKVR